MTEEDIEWSGGIDRWMEWEDQDDFGRKRR